MGEENYYLLFIRERKISTSTKLPKPTIILTSETMPRVTTPYWGEFLIWALEVDK